MASDPPVTVIIWPWFQSVALNINGPDTAATSVSLLVGVIVTVPVGALFRTTV